MATLLTNRRQSSEKGSLSRICLLQKEAAERYCLAGKSDPAVRVLQRAAAMKEEQEGDFRGAADILGDCISIYEEEEKWHYASEVYRDLIGLLARHCMYTPDLLRALDGHMRVLNKIGQRNGIFKAVMSKVVVCLTIGDLVAAENSLSSEVVRLLDTGLVYLLSSFCLSSFPEKKSVHPRVFACLLCFWTT